MKKFMRFLIVAFILIISFGSLSIAEIDLANLFDELKTGLGKLAEVKSNTGYASYYGTKYHGRKTSSGEIFDMNKFTAAHKTLPFGTKLKVTNLENGKSVVVKINDRGPFKPGRSLDLTYAAAKKIDMIGSGVVEVGYEEVE